MKKTKGSITLQTLNIQNFATFKNQNINFGEGLNIIIGETGSGKSLILDALQTILGARASKEMVRTQTAFACIEAIFQYEGEDITQYLDELGYPVSDKEIVIKRILYPNGKSKSYINFQQCKLTDLSIFCRHYIDLVGQFDNQKLLSRGYQLNLLDQFSKNNELLNEYRKIFLQFKELKETLKSLEESIQLKEQRLDFLNFQIQEIEEVNPSPEDEAILIKKKHSLLNLSDKIAIYNEISQRLSESEESILNSLNQIKNIVQKNPDFFAEISEDLLTNSIAGLEELSYQISKFDPEDSEDNIDFIVDRIDQYQKLKRKYGHAVEDIISQYQKLKDEKETLEDFENKTKDLQQAISKSREQLKKISIALTETRKKHALLLEKDLTQKIQNLNMRGARVNIHIQPLEEFSEKGLDEINLLVETNPGEGMHAMTKIASGGELSRILLALRQTLSSHDTISIFLFDEIDTGIGGETAIKIGEALKDVSKNSQVITITHLPQIAFFSDHIVKVDKMTTKEKGKTRTFSQAEEFHDSKIIKKIVKEMIPITQ
ncbi:MAG: AAA family ATPase [Halobacteriovoraceae bacterium]|nr:AAA family ATPase [Halobacteriovoraceae bacterium]